MLHNSTKLRNQLLHFFKIRHPVGNGPNNSIRIRIRIRIRIFIYPQIEIAIQQYFYDSVGSGITIYPLLIDICLHVFGTYVLYVHHVGRRLWRKGKGGRIKP